MALGAKLKLGFIDGSIPTPEEDSPEYTRWLRNEKMVFEFCGSKSLIDSVKEVRRCVINSNKSLCAFSKVEKQRKISSTVQEPSDFVDGSTQGNSKRKNKDEKKHCTVCQKDGHLAKTCFEIVGYQDWYKGKKNVRSGKVAANVSQDKYFAYSPLDVNTDGSSGIAFLNLIHYEALNHEWILDTRATYVDRLTDLRNLSPPVVVRLPDGPVQKILQCGNALFSSNLIVTKICEI
ncbi:hypothetical protein V2J09_021611 [Rumex salicifolius]